MSTEESENNVNHAHWAKSIKDGTAIIAFNEQTKNMQIRHRRELQNFNDTGLPPGYKEIKDLGVAKDLFATASNSGDEDIKTILELT